MQKLNMYYKIFIIRGLILSLVTNHSCSSKGKDVCHNLGTAACLNHKYNLINCTLVWGCDFIFYCPSQYQQNQTICSRTVNGSCPNINGLKYRVEHNRNSVAFIPSAPDFTLSERVCSYSMEQLLETGRAVNNFTLTFDRNEREMVLFASSDVSSEYIECYSRDVWGTSPIDLKLISTRKRRFVRRYRLAIHETPYIYFCVVSAPALFVKIKTKEVVAYSDTTPNQYIFKVATHYNGTRRFEDGLKQSCDLMKARNCKVVEWNKDDSYFYYFFYFQDPNLLSFGKVQSSLQIYALVISRQFKIVADIEYLRSIEYCLPDVTTNGIILHWNTTLIETWSTPQELCLDANRIPITRRCEGDFFTGAIWSEPSGNCSNATEIPERTRRLHQLVEEEIITEVFANITAVTDDFKVFTPVDVNLLSDGLKSLSATRNVTSFQEDFLLGISNTMRINSTVLRESQEQLNSTDKILDSLENFVMNVAEDITNLSTTIHSNVLTQISSPFISNVIGLALYKKGNKEFDQYEIFDVKFNQTFEDLPLRNLELAVYVPTDFIRNITNNLTPQEKEKFKIINTVFYSDGLFNDVSNENRSAGSRVVDVTIPAFVENKQVPVNVLFRPTLNFTGPDCVFWEYGRQKQGEWSTSGDIILEKYGNETLLQCTFNHITHFALLVLSENIIITDDGLEINPLESHELYLTLITVIGCGLSLAGILVMLFSALIFKGWYRKRLNSLQLASVLLMEIIILFVTDLVPLEDGGACVAIGALLHYIVLTKFIWMLIIARLQYLKFVAILENFQVKSHTAIYMIVGWFLPVIAVVLTLLIFPDNYQSGKLNFCYAEGYALYFFLILPAGVIILINVSVFASVMTTISESKAQDYGVDILKVQIRLGVLLFFMLGITWIFGILTHFLTFGWLMLVLIYLFCVLAPLQGFVLFVFIVLMDKTTVNLWVDMFGVTPRGARSYDILARSEVLYSSQSGNAKATYFRKRK